MRVITGIAKGKPLHSLSGKDTRPTGDKIKESIFSIIQFKVQDAIVLDLFAGSGQLGIEALSRGAKKAYFADINGQAVEIVKANLEYTRLEDSSRVDKLPYDAFLRLCKDTFDIAFIDPPYEKGLIEKALPLLAPKMNKDSVIICEHEKRLQLPETIEDFTIDKIYEHGSVTVTILRNGHNNENCHLPREL
jgi:16S rRNA (guanine(966)-N(2))-methyltransferase RsmD